MKKILKVVFSVFILVLGFYKINGKYNKSGLKNGDYITHINNEEVEDINHMSAILEQNINNKLISEGEKTISNIDAKLKKLDTIPQDAYDKSQDDFIRLVNETTKLGDDTKSGFNDTIKELNDMLNINMDTNKKNVDQNKK